MGPQARGAKPPAPMTSPPRFCHHLRHRFCRFVHVTASVRCCWAHLSAGSRVGMGTREGARPYFPSPALWGPPPQVVRGSHVLGENVLLTNALLRRKDKDFVAIWGRFWTVAIIFFYISIFQKNPFTNFYSFLHPLNFFKTK